MSNTNTVTGTQGSISRFFQNMNNILINHKILDKAVYNGVNGVPYAVIGMVTVVAGVFTFVTYSDYANELAESIETAEEEIRQDITFEENHISDENKEIRENLEEEEAEIQEKEKEEEIQVKEETQVKEEKEEEVQKKEEKEETPKKEETPEKEAETQPKLGGKSHKKRNKQKRHSIKHKIDRKRR